MRCGRPQERKSSPILSLTMMIAQLKHRCMCLDVLKVDEKGPVGSFWRNLILSIQATRKGKMFRERRVGCQKHANYHNSIPKRVLVRAFLKSSISLRNGRVVLIDPMNTQEFASAVQTGEVDIHHQNHLILPYSHTPMRNKRLYKLHLFVNNTSCICAPSCI